MNSWRDTPDTECGIRALDWKDSSKSWLWSWDEYPREIWEGMTESLGTMEKRPGKSDTLQLKKYLRLKKFYSIAHNTYCIFLLTQISILGRRCSQFP